MPPRVSERRETAKEACIRMEAVHEVLFERDSVNQIKPNQQIEALPKQAIPLKRVNVFKINSSLTASGGAEATQSAKRYDVILSVPVSSGLHEIFSRVRMTGDIDSIGALLVKQELDARRLRQLYMSGCSGQRCYD